MGKNQIIKPICINTDKMCVPLIEKWMKCSVINLNKILIISILMRGLVILANE